MGIVNPYMVKNTIGKGAGLSLELEADPGQSFLVKDILVGMNNNPYTDITVDKAMVGRFRTYGELGNHLGFPFGMTKMSASNTLFGLRPMKSILEYLGDLDIFKGYPVAEGQKMVITPLDSSKALGDVAIIYEEYEGGDIKSEDENGSESSEYFIVNYGDTGGTITTAGTHHYANQTSPTEFPEFPFGKVVPAKTEIELVGILASDVYARVDSNTGSYSTYLKLVQERTVLFDDDRNGILHRGFYPTPPFVDVYYGLGNSKLGNYSDADIKKPFMLKTPIVFGAGEELNIYLTTDIYQNPATISQPGAEIGLIQKIRRVS